MFFLNEHASYEKSNIPGLSDHNAVIMDTYIKPSFTLMKRRKLYNFKKANWSSLENFCTNLSNSIIHKSELNFNVIQLWDLFKSTLQLGISQNVPSKFVKNRSSLPWINKDLEKLVKKKTKLFKKAKSTGNWKDYKNHQKVCRNEFRKAENDFVNKTINEGLAENNQKPFWRYIKSRKCDNVGVSPLKDKAQLQSEPKKKAEILLNQFKSVFTKDTSNTMPDVKKVIQDSITSLKVTSKGVENLLSDIKSHKACGPDEIPNIVLKNCAKQLAPGISILFQKSLDTGVLPKDWTDANITPVFKKGDRHAAENYRPVSLTSVLSKTLEHIVCSELHKHFEKHDVLTKVNHGFRSGFSCETQLTITTDELARNIERGLQTDVAILDFSKAFDTVPHRKLLHKLRAYGVRGALLSWIESFLCNRSMRVVIDGESSSETKVLSGVPQGTVLGPLLFLVHINDLPDRVTSSVRLFADDCLLYRIIKSIKDQEELQKDLKSLEKWAEDWGMQFNAKKCYILTIADKGKHKFYELNSTILKNVNDNPYLGLILSKDLKWSTHIDTICKKASSTLGFIQRNLKRCPKVCKMTAYISLVRSTLEYGATIWDPYLEKDINKIEKIQRKAVRFICNDYRSKTPGSLTNMQSDLKLPDLKVRRKEKRLCFLYSIQKGKVPAIDKNDYLIPLQNKRHIRAKTFSDCVAQNIVSRHQNIHNNCFQLPTSKSIVYRNSFFPRTISEWNELPPQIVSSQSLNIFKDRLNEQ